jgi:patatin-like phospholipase/acyl hydrolase
MSTKYLLLSIDGGGLRGIVPLQFLKYIEQRTGKRIQDCFHFIAGTSTGGLIACALAVQKNNQPKFKLSDIENIYIENGKDIFPQGNAIGKFFRKLKSIVDPTFSAKGLSQVLKNNFGDDTMLDCSIPILVPAFDLKNNYAVMFKYRHAKKDQALNVSLIMFVDPPQQGQLIYHLINSMHR